MNFECVEVCLDLLVRCQSIVNCSSQLSLMETTEFARAPDCRKMKKMTNSTNVLDVKITRFGYRVDLIRERPVKDEAIKIVRRRTDRGDIIAEREVR